jgi:hypothetical protein
LASAREIATELFSLQRRELDDPSLAGGWAELALLYAYRGRAGSGDDDNEIASQCLARAFEGAATKSLPPWFYDGFTGVAWAAEHLHEQLFDAEDEDPNEAVDEALLEYVSQSPWQGDYDLVSGLVGIGIYALERLPRVTAVEFLEQIVERLDETAERSADGVTWLTRPELLSAERSKECPEGIYDMGVAHGVSGVIALLGGVCAAGVALSKARPLLDGAVAWLLRQLCSWLRVP